MESSCYVSGVATCKQVAGLGAEEEEEEEEERKREGRVSELVSE